MPESVAFGAANPQHPCRETARVINMPATPQPPVSASSSPNPTETQPRRSACRRVSLQDTRQNGKGGRGVWSCLWQPLAVLVHDVGHICLRMSKWTLIQCERRVPCSDIEFRSPVPGQGALWITLIKVILPGHEAFSECLTHDGDRSSALVSARFEVLKSLGSSADS